MCISIKFRYMACEWLHCDDFSEKVWYEKITPAFNVSIFQVKDFTENFMSQYFIDVLEVFFSFNDSDFIYVGDYNFDGVRFFSAFYDDKRNLSFPFEEAING